jgi:hemerythrin-like metal-binding protein
MESFEWKEKFSVHVDEMDNHHKKLLGYFNELQTVIASGEAAGKVSDTLLALIEYSDFHFAEEESLLKSMNSPELAVQINQHAYFTKEVKEMRNQFDQGKLPSQSVVAFLRDWFINHIMQEDFKYGEEITKSNPGGVGGAA